MSRSIQTGGETGDITAEEAETLVGSTLGCTMDTSIVRSGTYSFKCPTGAERKVGVSRNPGPFAQAGNTPTSLEVYGRVYFYLAGTPTTARAILMDFGNTAGIRLNTDLTISAVQQQGIAGNWGVVYQTSTATVPTSQWFRIELRVKKTSASPGNDGIIQVKLNGVLIIDQSGITTSSNSADPRPPDYDIGPHVGSMGVDLYFDDVALNTTDGTVNNSWPGPGAVLDIVPGSDTATVNWSVQGVASHFDAINDFPATSPDITTYLFTTSKTSGLEDRWNFSDTTSTIGSGDTINAVQLGVRVGGNGTTARSGKLQLRDASNNVVDSPDFQWNVNGFYTVYPLISRDQTMDGAPVALTKSYVDGLMAAALITDTTGREKRVTAVWLSIDFTAADTIMPPRSVNISAAVTGSFSY